MTTEIAGSSTRGRRHRRPHRAPGTRILAAGISTSVTLGLVSAMAAAAPPESQAAAGDPAPEWPVAFLKDRLVSMTPPPPQKIIRIEIHRKVYVPTPSVRTGSSGGRGGGGGSAAPTAPSRTSQSRAS